MKSSTIVFTVIGAFHLLIAALNAAHITLLPPDSIAGKVLRLYAEYTGTDNAFSFFAPNVASQTKVTFLMEDDSGRKAYDDLVVDNKEVNLRRNTTYSFFMMEEMRDLLTRSGAAMMFACYPEATKVTVQVDIYDTPTMKHYKAGERPKWKMAYKNVYALNN